MCGRDISLRVTDPMPKISPMRSALAVLAGIVSLGILNVLFMIVAGSALAPLYPPGTLPTTAGLALMIGSGVVNGALGGLLTARIAQSAPFAHAALLIGVWGVYTVGAIDQLTHYPGWFVIGLLLATPIGCLAGAALARRTARPK